MLGVYDFSQELEPFQGRSEEEITQILKNWGVRVIFGGYKSEKLVSSLHQEKIKVYASIGIFVGKDWWEKYPETRPINAEGKPVESEDGYGGLIPIIPFIREKKLKEIRELVTRFPIDGVWLDFIRWPCHWEVHHPRIEQTSFDPLTLEQFQKDSGVAIPEEFSNTSQIAKWILKHHRDIWTKWKCLQITDFVKEARKIIKDTGEDKIVGLFGVPWREKDYDNAIHGIIGQDYTALSKYVDIFSPMVYHLMCGRDVKWIREIATYIYQKSKKEIWPIIQARSIPSHLSKKEFKAALENALYAEGSSGVIVFTLEDLLREDRLNELIRAGALSLQGLSGGRTWQYL